MSVVGSGRVGFGGEDGVMETCFCVMMKYGGWMESLGRENENDGFSKSEN